MIESERLSFIKNNQSNLRVDKYINLCEQVSSGSDNNGSQRGKRVVLPSSFIGRRRFMHQLYFDEMTICSTVGFLYLFATCTCDPKWPKIVRLLEPHKLSAGDWPDVVAKAFRIKFEQVLIDLTKKHLLGKVIACKYYNLCTNFLIFFYVFK